MLCITLTLANSVPAEAAEQTVDQLVDSLNIHPDAVGGPVAGFKAIGQRQVQGCLASADEAVGFILSAARSATWGVHLTVIPNHEDAQRTPNAEPSLQRVMELASAAGPRRSEEHTSELQSRGHLVCRLLLEKKNDTRDAANA